jgi:hypothetical protein
MNSITGGGNELLWHVLDEAVVIFFDLLRLGAHQLIHITNFFLELLNTFILPWRCPQELDLSLRELVICAV